MASQVDITTGVARAAEKAAAELVRVSHWGGASYVSLPLIMPSGSSATVRITSNGRDYRVDDGGFAYRELESIGAERSFPKVAAKFAAFEELETDRRVIFTYAPEQELVRAICDVATASHAVVDDVYRRLGDDAAVEIEDYLRERLEAIFAGNRIEPDEEIKGASTHSWKMSATVHLPSGLIVFQAVPNHPYSVYRASTAFRDLGELRQPPKCVAVVKDMALLGNNLNVLAQAGRVIQGDQSDETYRLAAG
jgi:hypothetical protein